MTAAKYVALAKRAADKQDGQWLHPGRVVLVVLDDGTSWIAGSNLKARSNEAMRAKITLGLLPGSRPDQLRGARGGMRFHGDAFKAALVRALLASAVTVSGADVPFANRPETYDRNAYAAGFDNLFAFGATEAEARDALLDALLAPAEAAR